MLPKPKQKNYKTLEQLLEELPQLQDYLNKSFIFNKQKAIVKIRRKSLDEKPLLYLWNKDRECYLSSLYPADENNVFRFEVFQKYYFLTFDGKGKNPTLSQAS